MAKAKNAKVNDLLEALTRGSVTIDIQTKNTNQIESAAMQLIKQGQEGNKSLVASLLLNGKGVSGADQAVIAKALEQAIKLLLTQSAELKNKKQITNDVVAPKSTRNGR